jgi:hypothetical protein
MSVRDTPSAAPRRQSVRGEVTERLDRRLLSAKVVAARLGISIKTLRGHVRDGSLRYVNVGRGDVRPRYRFTEQDVVEFEQARR